MARLLRTAGYSVRGFSSARDFLAADRGHGPACLLLDIRMPDLTGIELQRRLVESGDDTPVVFLSGENEFRALVAESAVAGSAVQSLAKTCSESELLAAVTKAMEKARCGSRRR